MELLRLLKEMITDITNFEHKKVIDKVTCKSPDDNP